MNEGAADAGVRVPTLRAVVKTTVTHTITCFVFGLLALVVFDYARLYAETELVHLMRPTTDPVVIASPLCIAARRPPIPVGIARRRADYSRR